MPDVPIPEARANVAHFEIADRTAFVMRHTDGTVAMYVNAGAATLTLQMSAADAVTLAGYLHAIAAPNAVTAEDLADALDAMLATQSEVCICEGDHDNQAEYATTLEDAAITDAESMLLRFRTQVTA